ncbi:hypothetical protein AB0K60_22210 [Thermopolyspora sp. NPDC052614]|uniref:hypothetical protein n=1 Tax=Thermopolyspora sp. NPDC052614 TaxID=3155682 RepID=UPI00341EA339
MGELTRRDVARALLAVPSGQALVALPGLRREMEDAGRALTPVFWESAREALRSIESGKATVGDVQRWLESTGTEPMLLTRGYFVWADEDERGPVAREMHERLVRYLEEQVAAGVVDPDRLAAGDADARAVYEQLQERWLRTALPDGRVPGVAVTDEQDDELFAERDEQEAFALAELRRILAELPQPVRPDAELREAAVRLRALLGEPGYPGNVLRACAGFDDEPVPEGDEELWLAVAAGIAGPISDLPEDQDTVEEFTDLDAELSTEDSVLASLCAIDYPDWLAAVAALARRGPGVLASPERIARMIAESEDVDTDIDEVGDDLDGLGDLDATETLFAAVTPLWQVLGVVDDNEVLTPLGWWGLPKALERSWSS